MKFFVFSLLLSLVCADNAPQQQNNQQTTTAASSSSSSSQEYSSEYGVLQFQNVGFEGHYYNVKKIDSSSNESCTCELNTGKPVDFSGAITPLDGELSVHIRGPVNLQKFGYWVADSYTAGETNGSWSRLAYYDSEDQTAENVTFLSNVGENITCLGKALDYIDSDGVSQATESTVLSNVTIQSGDEFVIMSNVSCGKSGFGKDCGVYRDGIPAFHGYYGTTKMFLFQFLAPQDDSDNKDVENYNMPAIWLLNAHIPRTAQYATNSNCSAWASGGGEFDIFEILNTTESTHFYSTIHDFQGTDDIYTGLANEGYIERVDSVMMGGVIFGSDGTATVFMSNETTFDETINNSDLSSWISTVESKEDEHIMSLSSVTSESSKSDGSTLRNSWLTAFLLGVMCIL